MTASTAAFAALIDDETTSLPFKRTAGSPGDLAELRTRPWWAIDQAGRELLAKGIPVVRRRAAVQAQGGRVYDGAVFRARSKEDMRRFDDTAARIAAAAPADRIGPAIPLPNLPLVYPADPDAPPAIGWTTVREFVAVMTR